MRRFLPVLVLLAGCSASLEPLLSAPDDRTFDEKLKIHGPVDSSEVSTLKREARGQDPSRARNAASLLTLSREPEAEQELENLGATTNDVKVWSIAAASRLLKEQLDLGAFPKSLERPEMIREGLKSADSKVYKTSFALAHRLKLPELQAEIPQALQSQDSEIQALAIAALSPEQVLQRMDEIKKRLKEADYKTFPKMAIALVETRDPKAWDAVVKAYLENDDRLSFLNDVNFHMTSAIYAFMVDRAARKDKFAEDAYDSLASQVVQETYPCDRFLMNLTLARLQAAARDKRIDQEAEILVTIASWGSNPSKHRPDWDKVLHGPAALEAAQKWLSEHRK